MVNNHLPLPVQKYIGWSYEQIQSLLEEYPFYNIPKLAEILKKSKEGEDIHELNYFGFEHKKIIEYHEIVLNNDINLLASYSEDIDSIQDFSQHNPIDFSKEISADLIEENNAQEIFNSEYNDLIQDSSQPNQIENIEFESTELIEENNAIENFNSEDAIEERQIEASIESKIEDQIIWEEIKREEPHLDLSKIQTDILQNHIDETQIEFVSPPTVLDLINQSRNSSQISPSITDISESNLNSNTTDQSSQIQRIEIGKIKLGSIQPIEIGNISNELDSNEIKLDFNFDSEENSTSDNIDIVENIDVQKVEDSNENIQHNDNNSLNTSNDEGTVNEFTLWLNRFTNQSKPVLNNQSNSSELLDIKKDTEPDKTETSLVTSPESHENSDEIPLKNLSKDDELETVLQDSFFLDQIQKKQQVKFESTENRTHDNLGASLKSNEVISETFALLYAQQGNFSKAIEIYQKLIELFPEKSRFFVTQIEKLKK